MESAHFLPFWWEGEIDGSVKGGGMRRFQFPIKAANLEFLARVWNRTKPFLDLKHLPAHQAKVKQAAKRRSARIIFVWQPTFHNVYCHRRSKNVVLYHEEASTLYNRRGRRRGKLDHLSRFASRCLTSTTPPTPGGSHIGGNAPWIFQTLNFCPETMFQISQKYILSSKWAYFLLSI